MRRSHEQREKAHMKKQQRKLIEETTSLTRLYYATREFNANKAVGVRAKDFPHAGEIAVALFESEKEASVVIRLEAVYPPQERKRGEPISLSYFPSLSGETLTRLKKTIDDDTRLHQRYVVDVRLRDILNEDGIEKASNEILGAYDNLRELELWTQVYSSMLIVFHEPEDATSATPE